MIARWQRAYATVKILITNSLDSVFNNRPKLSPRRGCARYYQGKNASVTGEIRVYIWLQGDRTLLHDLHDVDSRSVMHTDRGAGVLIEVWVLKRLNSADAAVSI